MSEVHFTTEERNRLRIIFKTLRPNILRAAEKLNDDLNYRSQDINIVPALEKLGISIEDDGSTNDQMEVSELVELLVFANFISGYMGLEKVAVLYAIMTRVAIEVYKEQNDAAK